MQGVDLAIVELQPTLETLIDDGIQPLALAIELQLAGPTPEPQVVIGKIR
ncbi:Trypsin domain protein [Pseudomonas amygdali pv. dendropanacis]|uniref:Trypsin domain protein n=1 Tax=Pseudomonas amygdali pv. dendropanacis TaxID=235272 RepID=A0A0P9QQA5_PSEA0|nr:Trypsin domain protein [Pseudomonas amygdali pv. dendropanacis]